MPAKPIQANPIINDNIDCIDKKLNEQSVSVSVLKSPKTSLPPPATAVK